MRYNFENLKTVQCLNAVELRIPIRWDKTEIDSNGVQHFWEDDEETGTFFVGLDQYQMPHDASEFDARKHVHDLVKHMVEEGTYRYADSTIVTVPEGYLWRARYDTRDSRGELRNFRYMFFLFRGNRHAIVEIRLAIPFEVLDDNEILDLLGIMDREILAARIDPFAGLDSGDDNRKFFPRLRPVDFDGMVILPLPESMICRRLEAPNHWYGFFDPDTIEARLMVMATEYELAEGADRQKGAESIVANMRRDFPDRHINLSPIADGFLSYCGYDDLESREPDDPEMEAPWRNGPMHYHWWRVLRFKNNEARMVDVLLNMPLPRAEAPQLKALADVLHAEIGKAEFPGFGKAA